MPTAFGIPDGVQSATDVRRFVIDWLRRELIGPDPGHPLVQWSADRPELRGEEVLRPQDPPRYRYGAGILFPRAVAYSGLLDPGDDAAAVDGAEEVVPEAGGTTPAEAPAPATEDLAGETDGEVEASYVFLPSTMGVSFLVRVGAGLAIEASWATYAPHDLPGYAQPGRQSASRPGQLWFRTPAGKPVEIAADELLAKRRLRRTLTDGEPSLVVDIMSRPWGSNARDRLVTVTMMNVTEAEPRNESCFFQCGFRVVPTGDGAFLPYPERPDEEADEEELSLRLLYRHRPVYAVGHGCAADWDDAPGSPAAVRTETMPVFEQAPIAPLEDIPGVNLSMRSMAEADLTGTAASCRALADAYERWIERCERDLDGPDGPESTALRETGRRHLELCRQCLVRIHDGVNVLESEPDAFEAFRLMNRAMVEQRAHYRLSSEASLRRTWVEGDGEARPERPFERPDYPYATVWRPFQLAFVLMNLRPFTKPDATSRDLVDVIWFPTGGGKTEAYLGLTAFAILHRRLVDPANAGTTVLMRYTLRLLTTQQFQRAASMICALELIRRERVRELGEAPVTIGLWLGSGVTPNRNEDAVAEYGKLGRGEGDNRFIVLSCPWCGVDMGPRPYGKKTRIFGYEKVGSPAQIRFRCEDPGCDFHDQHGLPLEVVDERIYARPPTLVIGTVDKFAMLPWEPRARALFGRQGDEGCDPPDLVIQDELHLIAGPLGSMVGHYETVIDELCRRPGGTGTVSAKIVASTATISRASEQVRSLYARDAMLFPPQGLRAGESFFARERSDIPGRVYVGVLASALSSHVTAQIRTVAALLQAPALLQPPACAAVSDGARDPYWTLMAYFNSLRELGRAATLIQADIREYLNAVWDRIGLRADLIGEEGRRLRRFINRDEELTSRLRSSDIPGTLQKLFTALPDENTVDLCLATNMIQVGLDVPRLSLMTIVGQPKTASEYIQASSRVGRDAQKPGLVVTNYNPFKPRDRSHFESFRSYHENVYRHVEPTSVTPFSIPVCTRAIHALAVVVARFTNPALLDSPQAGIDAGTRDRIHRIVLGRVRAVGGIDQAAVDENVRIAREILDDFLEDWNRRRPQFYGEFGTGAPTEPLMWPAGKTNPHPDWISMRSTQSSMRSVDAESEAVPVRNYLVAEDT